MLSIDSESNSVPSSSSNFHPSATYTITPDIIDLCSSSFRCIHSPNPSPALTLIARGWIAFGDVEPYLDFNYVASVIDIVVPV